MPSSMLFGINTEGKVYGLSTNGKKWREFPYSGLQFKKISSVPSFLWALGGDRQIYLHVHSLDIPIRIKEEVYENERWFPIEGFGKRMLPTDRFRWSNKDGTVERKKENIRLPSMAWQWESDWQLELTLDGYPLNYDGWTYAIDFPASYSPDKQWTSCVRRRKWYRYRRYGAMFAWCAIPPLHKDPTKEPFIDVCIGGHSKLDVNKGMLSVWAVTVYGRIMFRSGVSTECPDGTRWLSVPSPKSSEIRCASCSAIGILWVILNDGRAAVRYGITSKCLTGEKWLEVPSPEKNLKLVQLSAGLNSLWAITDDNRVWFRKGIRADRSHASEELLKGSGWIEMVAEMSSVSVSAHDQVFAVNEKDKRIYYRSGIDSTELSGRKWRLIEARTQMNLSSSQRSSLSSLPNESGDSSISSEQMMEKTSKSAPPYAKFDAMLLTETTPSKCEKYEIEIDSSFKMRSWSPIRGGGTLLAMEAHPDTNDSCFDVDTQKQVFREKDDLSIGCQQSKTLWSSVCAGAVYIDSLNLPKWFVEESVIEDYDEKEPWRNKILTKLRNRNLSESLNFENYESAIETTSWTKCHKFKINLPGSQVLVECLVELEWIENNATGPDSGTLAVLSCNRDTSLLQLSLSEITCVLNSSEPGQPCLTVNTAKTVETGMSPLKLYFTSENDFEDWLHSISTVCYQISGMSEVPDKKSVWCTTRLGDIYVTDVEPLKKIQATENGRFAKEYNIRDNSDFFNTPLLNGFPINAEVTINGYIPAKADRFFVNLICGHNDDVVFHFNPRFDENKIVRNTCVDGKWGSEETEGSLLLQPGSDFTITILCLEEKYKIFVNGSTYSYYQHRLPAENVTDVQIGGLVDVFNILYETDKIILNLSELTWRKIDGSLHKVETCSEGVTWGLGYDCVPWVYTGNLPQNCSKSGDKSTIPKHTMVDTKETYVYENQRWNPLTGYSTHCLPTDRYMWSDETGKEKLSKDNIKLQTHWQWANEWQIDYKTIGGTDQDGWQYAIDFPASYHPHNNISDTCRRRRWVRTSRIVIPNSPWQEIGNTKLKDVSISILDPSANPKTIAIWGVTINGEVLYRNGVTAECHSGERWVHVEIDQTVQSISAGGTRQVWCCGDNGICFWRFGITATNPLGDNWQYVEPVSGCFFQKVAVGKWTVWALDTKGDLYIRKEITPVFPEGTHWRKVQNNDNNKFRHISASEEYIWAITNEGVICRRLGISEEYPEGVSWIYGLSGDWLYLSEK